ncbi:hypothetical protein O181_029913 [Austropuccinia psidii MF-1]|uniref:Uncharacterized protein n=1 Tax=Austropuccinia psidii MF-1 TaxID=1389203 RepID=A0A9Q3CWP2_9BASI|nr:hypothetical protein [Austropuccinia psidii MF-1]
MGKGNVKITRHVKFLSNYFPERNVNNNDSDRNLFILVPNRTDNASSVPINILRDSNSDHGTLSGKTPEPVKLTYSLPTAEN